MRPGPPPKPTHLKLLQGNPGGKRLNRNEPKPAGALFKAPPDLHADAVPHWTYAIKCAPRGLLRRLDLRTLVVYCNACAAHSKAATRVFDQGITIKRRGMKMEHINPAIRIMDQQAGIMLRAAAEMGFTPSSRSRIVVKEGELAEPDNAFDEFRDDAN